MSAEKTCETALREFARWAIKRAWAGEDLDGGDVQEKAWFLGLIVTVPGGYDPEIHGEDDYAEPGDEYYVFAPGLKDPEPREARHD